MSATRFVIASFGRTGSTWLTLLVRSHPAILCHGEIFNPPEIKWAPGHVEHSKVAAAWTVASRDRDPAGFLETVLADDRGHQAVGAKMLNWHQPELLFEVARRPDVHKVILRRRNRVRAFLSRERSDLLLRRMRESYDGFRIRLDPDELLAYARRYDSFYDSLRTVAAGAPVFEVVYEDLLDGTQSAQDVVAFLGVEPSDFPLASGMRRQSRDRTRDVVTNFDELSELVRGTPLQAELEE